MSWLSSSSLPMIWLVLHFSILARSAVASGSSYFCSGFIYDRPSSQDCVYALATLPRADPNSRYYVEPQLGTNPAEPDWQGWKDERPKPFKQRMVQIPKFWSHGEQAYSRIGDIVHLRMHSIRKEEKLKRWLRIVQRCPLELRRR